MSHDNQGRKTGEQNFLLPELHSISSSEIAAAERRGYLKGVNDSLDFLKSLRGRFVTDEAWSTSYADMKLALKASAGE